MNQIFGYQITPKEASLKDSAFDGAQEVLLNGKHGKVKIFTQPRSSIQCCYSQEYDSYAYVWGIPAHPEVAMPDIPEWCIRVAAEKRYDSFKELIGTFVIIIDEPGQNRITFITDILGIRPMFVGNKNDRIIFGSDVWTMHKTGLSNGRIDYDAVSAWVSYGFNCTDGSLFADLRRLPAGSIVIFQDGKSTQVPYAEFGSKSTIPNAQQASEEIHHIVSSAVKTLLTNHRQVNIALSGGWDSRYLLAMLSSFGKTSFNCATVGYTEEEESVAHEVAGSLKIPLKDYPVQGSIWDIYDQVYHFMADGFPISKNVSYRIAQDYAGMPMVNGFMGDALIRGDSDTYMDKYETEWKDDPVDVLQRKHTRSNFRLFRKDVAEKIRTRARIWMERAVKEGSKMNKILGWQDFYYTHRFYISNNFLQHLGLAEALLPFYNWPLLSYKMNHAYIVFTRDTYLRILQKQFPELAKIPHASDLSSKKKKPLNTAGCTKEWARQLIPIVCSKKWLSLLSKRLCIPLNAAGVAGLRCSEDAVFLFEKLYLLEKRIKDAGLDFDWEGI
ncbi:MAG: hypothetical protein HY756_04810 [Nitrospirae bacterium]|nr:hypothetical protein [Nitrospirota bacterium]